MKFEQWSAALLTSATLIAAAPVMAQDDADDEQVDEILEIFDSNVEEQKKGFEAVVGGAGDDDDLFGGLESAPCREEGRTCETLSLADFAEDFEPAEKALIPIRFQYDSAEFAPESAGALASLCAAVNERPDYTVTLEAHTDASGPDAYNMSLSERRASSLARHLTENCGVVDARIKTLPFGERKLDENFDPDAPEQRRVLVFATVS